MMNPYDELPYKSFSIEWTAPERLAVASILHGGPRPYLREYRVLELGCGDGSNLLPLAYYRRNATFVGVDGARSQISIADSGKAILKLSNINFIHADFLEVDRQLEGQFDFIIAHGVFSWVPNNVRDALLCLCAHRLRSGGLLYLNYNTYPGWNVRGMVREFLLAQTAGESNLSIRAQLAQDVAAQIFASITVGEKPYSQLMANEFQFVCENHVSYVAHEYLAADNHPYWRSEFMELARTHGVEYVADADFNYDTGRIPEDVAPRLTELKISGRSIDDTIDLLCYRQLHTPILTQSPLIRRPLSSEEFENLLIASCLTPVIPENSGNPMFQHPNGYQVEAKEEVIRAAFERLHPFWPRALRVGDVFPNVLHVMEDLRLLHRNGLIELRCIDPVEFDVPREPLNNWELSRGVGATTPFHTRDDFSANSTDNYRHTTMSAFEKRVTDENTVSNACSASEAFIMGAAL